MSCLVSTAEGCAAIRMMPLSHPSLFSLFVAILIICLVLPLSLCPSWPLYALPITQKADVALPTCMYSHPRRPSLFQIELSCCSFHILFCNSRAVGRILRWQKPHMIQDVVLAGILGTSDQVLLLLYHFYSAKGSQVCVSLLA